MRDLYCSNCRIHTKKSKEGYHGLLLCVHCNSELDEKVLKKNYILGFHMIKAVIHVTKGQDRFHTAYNAIYESKYGISFQGIMKVTWSDEQHEKGLKIMLDQYVKEGTFKVDNGLYKPKIKPSFS